MNSLLELSKTTEQVGELPILILLSMAVLSLGQDTPLSWIGYCRLPWAKRGNES